MSRGKYVFPQVMEYYPCWVFDKAVKAYNADYHVRVSSDTSALTAAALLKTDFRNQDVDYTNLLALTGYLTQDPLQVEEMFRRMVVNLVVDNKDDHAKNFSFICRAGKWSLSPAYDITYSPEGSRGEHATSLLCSGIFVIPQVLKPLRIRFVIKDIPGLAIQDLADGVERSETNRPGLACLEDGQVGQVDVHLLGEFAQGQSPSRENNVEVYCYHMVSLLSTEAP